MKRFVAGILLGCVLAVSAGCAGAPRGRTGRRATAAVVQDTVLSSDLRVRLIRPGVWQHTSTIKTAKWGVVPSNGLILAASRGAVLLDTPWNDRQTRVLLAWAKRTLAPIRYAVVTHAHQDRTGGLRTLYENGVEVYALDKTAELLQRRGYAKPGHLFSTTKRVDLGGRQVELFYPGAGHAPDNIVVWIADQQLLYAGCLVKGRQASSIGNVEGIDLTGWRRAIERLGSRYPDAGVVIPGHGQPGTRALLAHTLRLLQRGKDN